MEKPKIMAIDYGLKKVGLAMTDDAGLMAFGKGILLNKGDQNLADQLSRLFISENCRVLLFGLPLNEDGEETEQTARIRHFANFLTEYLTRQNYDFRVEYEDESFSSFEAQQLLKDLPGKKSFKTDDELAAVLLLNRYLERIK